MECDQCGAYRPRSGPCPECGAPPPGTFSSLRNYRNGGSDPSASSRRGRGVGSSAAGSSARQRNNNSSRWSRQSGDGWQDDGGYDDAPAPRSSARNRRRDDYDEVDLGRALVPTNDDIMPMIQGGAGVPALPGFPETDEEERALGIRRPVYIPATGEKRKRKLGSWRIISGVLSVMLICVASCAVTGVLARSQIEKVFQEPVKIIPTAGSFDFTGVPATPVATKGPAGNYVQSGVTSRAVNYSQDTKTATPVDITSHFHAGDTVYVWVYVRGAPLGQQHTLTVQWYLNGVAITPPTVGPGHTTATLDGKDSGKNVYFGINYPVAAVGMAKIFWDMPANDKGTNPTDPALAMTINFAVEVAPTATPGKAGTPGKGTPAAPTATPKKSDVQGGAPVASREQLGAA